MSGRVLEVLVMGLLIVVTVNAVFQFQNHQTLQRILEETRDRAPAATIQPQPAPTARTPAPPAPGEPRPTSSRDGADDPQPRPGEEEAPFNGEPFVATDDDAEIDAPQPASGGQSAEPEPQSQESAETPEMLDPEPGDLAVGPADVTAQADEPSDQPEPAAGNEAPSADAEGDEAESQPAPAEESEPDPSWVEHEDRVVTCIRRLLDGDYDWVHQQFTRDMARRLPRRQIAAALERVEGSLDEVRGYENVTSGLEEDHHAFRVVIDTTADQQLTFTLTLNGEGEIAGLLMR